MKKEFVASNGSVLKIDSFDNYIQIIIRSELSDKFTLDLNSPHDEKEAEILMQSLIKILKKEEYNPCPPWRLAPDKIKKEYEYIQPVCHGEILEGSGGHRIHGKCNENATWYHPNDAFSYCSKHVLEQDKKFYREDWEKEF